LLRIGAEHVDPEIDLHLIALHAAIDALVQHQGCAVVIRAGCAADADGGLRLGACRADTPRTTAAARKISARPDTIFLNLHSRRYYSVRFAANYPAVRGGLSRR
jgi:hypothetical protein